MTIAQKVSLIVALWLLIAFVAGGVYVAIARAWKREDRYRAKQRNLTAEELGEVCAGRVDPAVSEPAPAPPARLRRVK